MFARKFSHNPAALIRIGLLFLIAASLWRMVIERRQLLSESLTDFGGGLLYGVTFGCLGLGIWLTARRRRNAR